MQVQIGTVDVGTERQSQCRYRKIQSMQIQKDTVDVGTERYNRCRYRKIQSMQAHVCKSRAEDKEEAYIQTVRKTMDDIALNFWTQPNRSKLGHIHLPWKPVWPNAF